jgi:hypothetical protein
MKNSINNLYSIIIFRLFCLLAILLMPHHLFYHGEKFNIYLHILYIVTMDSGFSMMYFNASKPLKNYQISYQLELLQRLFFISLVIISFFLWRFLSFAEHNYASELAIAISIALTCFITIIDINRILNSR